MCWPPVSGLDKLQIYTLNLAINQHNHVLLESWFNVQPPPLPTSLGGNHPICHPEKRKDEDTQIKHTSYFLLAHLIRTSKTLPSY